MLQMRTAARMRPHAVDSSELSSFRTQTLARKHYLPRDPRLGGILLALCDLAVFAAVLALVAMLLAPAGADLFATSWPHFALTSVLSFIVAHSLARSYDLEGAVHASLFDFVIKPAVLTCAATTFSYGVKPGSATAPSMAARRSVSAPALARALRHHLRDARDGGRAAAGLRPAEPLAGGGPFSTSVVVFGADPSDSAWSRSCARNIPIRSVVGIFDDRVQRVPGHVQGIAVEGGLDALIEFVKAAPAVDKVLIALPMSAKGASCSC